MRTSIKVIFVGISIALLILVCIVLWWLHGATYVITLTESQIQAAISKKFPLVKSYMKILEVTYANPIVVLEGGSGRVKVGLDAETNLTVEGLRLRGSAFASAKVDYDRSSGTFYLRDATIESLKIDGLPAKWTRIATDLGNLGIRKCLDRIPVYRLRQEDFKQNLARYLLKEVKVKDRELVLTLGLGD